MCGLFSISSPDCSKYDSALGLETLRHRGPDSGGIFLSAARDCTLGYKRLSIIALSDAGNQPMADHSGRYTMVSNGEIYNFIELRRELETDYGSIAWQSDSDSEVLLEGCALHGADFLHNPNGTYAFAI